MMPTPKKPKISIHVFSPFPENNDPLVQYPDTQIKPEFFGGSISIAFSDGSSLIESKDGSKNRLDDYTYYFVIDLHTILNKIIKGEICGFHILGDAYWLVFIPIGQDVEVILRSQNSHYIPWKGIQVSKKDWIEAVQTVTKETIDQVLSINPKLADSCEVRELEKKYNETQRILDEI